MSVSTSSDKQPASAGADPAPKPSRRAFSPAYKLAMIAEYENAPNGEKGALLRREGLYSSHIIEWTRARNAGLLGRPGDGLANSGTAVAGRPKKKNSEQLELERLRRQNEKLQADLKKTRMALDIMGKAHALLEELAESADDQISPKKP